MRILVAILLLACSSAYGLTIEDLGLPAGCRAIGINDAGQIAGHCSEGAFIWEGGKATTVWGIWPVVGLNNQGLMAGYGLDGEPVLIDSSTLESIPISLPCQNSTVTDISANYVTGQTCGHGYRYRIEKGNAELVGFPFSRDFTQLTGVGRSVNDVGEVVGQFVCPNHVGTHIMLGFIFNGSPVIPNHFIWDLQAVNNNGMMAGQDPEGLIIGNGVTFTGFRNLDGYTDIVLRSINDNNIAVGVGHALFSADRPQVIYQDESLTALPEEVVEANEINNLGQIAGTAIINGEVRAVRILP